MDAAEVTVIVPFLNEEDRILGLIQDLNSQTIRPQKVIFVDSGSTDSSLKIIQDSSKELNYEVFILENEGSEIRLPGRSRNKGLSLVSTDIVAYIDVGLKVAPDWLEKQLRSDIFKETKACLGKCVFKPRGFWATIICALSNGVDSFGNTLPGSVLKTDLAKKLCPFPEDLRAGEDLVWKFELLNESGCNSSGDGVVIYDSYSNSLWSNIKKWHLYSSSVMKMNNRPRQSYLYLIGGLLFLILFVLFRDLSCLVFLGYLVMRGIVDPVRRSARKVWFSENFLAFLIAPFVAFSIDLSKTFGFLKGLILKG